MSLKSLLTHEISLPDMPKHSWLYALLLMLLPNVVFLLLAWFTDTARPLVNLDYLVPVLLLALPIRSLKWLGIIAFMAAVLFDTLMFVMQLFPFMDLNGALYLLPFIINAPSLYKILAISLVLYVIFMPWALHKLLPRTHWLPILLALAVMVPLAYFSGHLQYHERSLQSILFGGNNFYYAKSQWALYMQGQQMDFLVAAKAEPVFSELQFDQASGQLQGFDNQKVLVIVNESWGQPQNQALQDAVLLKLSQNKALIEDWKQGSFPFVGATVEGEMRELCNLKVEGFFLSRTPEQQLAGCLPNRYRQQGYTTMAMHGASSQMYDRFSWYPKAGFQKALFGEQMLGKRRCQAFNGVCDDALFDEVAKTFAANGKVFFYWLTLTTHSTYPEKDLFNHRLQCEAYGLPKDTLMCRNFSLQTQFFDGLATLLQRAEMKGTEVLIVGDHAPPVINLGENFKYMQQGEVAWVHFKVR